MDVINGQRMFLQMLVVKKHLDAGYTITDKQAKAMFGIARVASVIHRLNKRGEGIEKDTVSVQTPYGTGNIARYYKPRGGSN